MEISRQQFGVRLTPPGSKSNLWKACPLDQQRHKIGFGVGKSKFLIKEIYRSHKRVTGKSGYSSLNHVWKADLLISTPTCYSFAAQVTVKVVNFQHEIHFWWKMSLVLTFGIHNIKKNSNSTNVRTAFWSYPNPKIYPYQYKQKNKGIKSSFYKTSSICFCMSLILSYERNPQYEQNYTANLLM